MEQKGPSTCGNGRIRRVRPWYHFVRILSGFFRTEGPLPVDEKKVAA